MKIIKLSFVFFMLCGVALNAQIDPKTFSMKIPGIPSDICNEEVKLKFTDEVNTLRDEISAEIRRLKKEAKQDSKGLDEQNSINMMNQIGFNVSEADMKKMKTASKEEKKAMADKMLQQNMNISIDEAQKASKMSKAGKQAWGEGVTTEMMADAQTNPDKNKQTQKNSIGIYEKVQEQSQLAEKIQAGIMKFEEKLSEFNKIKEKASIEYKDCGNGIDKKYANMVNQTLGDEHAEKIKNEKSVCYQRYCGFIAQKYKTLMDERFQEIVTSGDDYNRMDVLTNELALTTTGTKGSEPALMYLEALKEYMGYLTDLP